jgi:hypothetical protein
MLKFLIKYLAKKHLRVSKKFLIKSLAKKHLRVSKNQIKFNFINISQLKFITITNYIESYFNRLYFSSLYFIYSLNFDLYSKNLFNKYIA